LGGYVSSDGSDPFEAGWLIRESGRFFVNVDSVRSRVPGDSLFLATVADLRLDSDDWNSLLRRTYFLVRGLPEDLHTLRASTAYRDNPAAWFCIDVNGVMTRLKRRNCVSREAIRSALGRYYAHNQRILFEEGTIIVGEHLDGDDLVETTVMIKRGDGFWDFAAYDAEGTLSERTETPPKQLNVPLQCVGCHYGERLFEPEKSYPVDAPSRGMLVRRIYFDPRPTPDLVEFFDEHRRRSDGILGLYATLFVQELMAAKDRGELRDLDAELLTSLGL
jgi:hypothetical protein